MPLSFCNVNFEIFVDCKRPKNFVVVSMNGTENDGPDDEEDEEDPGPMPVDDFINLPTFHRKKVAFYRHMHNLPGGEEDDGT